MMKLSARLVAVLIVLAVLIKIADACPCGLQLSDEEAYFIVKITGECPCRQKMSVEEAYLKADGVFIGKAVASNPSAFKIGDQRYPYVDYVFEVIETYKGTALNRKVVFRTGVGGSECGYDFSLEDEYLIYGYKYKENLYWTNACTRNNRIGFCETDELILLDQIIK